MIRALCLPCALWPLQADLRRDFLEKSSAYGLFMLVLFFVVFELCPLCLLHFGPVLLLELQQLLLQLFHQLAVLDGIVSLESHDPVVDQLEVDTVPRFVIEVKHHASDIPQWNPRP